MALAFRSAPVHGLAYLVSTVAVAAIPIAAAWLTKFVLDRLTSTAGLTNAPSPTSELVGLALALAAAGVALGVVPQVAQYLRAEMDRRAALRAHDELFAAIEQVTGVARFEDPRFQDRLRLAQQSASSPAQTADAVFEVVRGTLTLGGFVGSLAVISPGFTAVVLAAAVPAVLLELRLSRRRAAMLWRIGPIERRQMLYGDLLASAEAAKEIRLFGLGSYLRGRSRAGHGGRRLEFVAAVAGLQGTLGDMERIRGAAVRAGIDGTLSRLPRGYDTLLTRLFFGDSENDDPQNGVMLSGGQWQRVALARAFLREKRELMILDEPNAGLDPDAEHEVHDRLRAIRAGRGSLLISHRLSAVRDADLIVVLSDGVITEQGRHADLLAAQGAYARMFTVQAAGYTEEPGGQGRPDAMSEGTRR
ncbi:ATP-binding cassette domain-containing protein [Nonomuraea phyllanthi]|nr:ATP-binding cassette domain-containing protein [Nonomuraea phyllanthi]